MRLYSSFAFRKRCKVVNFQIVCPAEEADRFSRDNTGRRMSLGYTMDSGLIHSKNKWHGQGTLCRGLGRVKETEGMVGHGDRQQ